MHLNIAIYCAFYEITARNFTIGFPKSELMELALWHYGIWHLDQTQTQK